MGPRTEKIAIGLLVGILSGAAVLYLERKTAWEAKPSETTTDVQRPRVAGRVTSDVSQGTQASRSTIEERRPTINPKISGNFPIDNCRPRIVEADNDYASRDLEGVLLGKVARCYSIEPNTKSFFVVELCGGDAASFRGIEVNKISMNVFASTKQWTGDEWEFNGSLLSPDIQSHPYKASHVRMELQTFSDRGSLCEIFIRRLQREAQ